MSVGNKILFAGGFDDMTGTGFSTQVDVLDIRTGAWATADMKTLRMHFAGAAVDGVAVMATKHCYLRIVGQCQ